MSKITKAVIPVAGLGLNFLPATKATAKEMLPIVDKPILQFVLEEAQASGIEEFIFVTGGHKRSIEDHFDANFELEQNLKAKGKTDLLKIAQETTMENVYYVRQPSPKGLGDAVLKARAFVDDEPFVVILADNIMKSDRPLTQLVMEAFEAEDKNIIAMQSSSSIEELSSYGVIDIEEKVADNLYTFSSIIEKPQPEEVKGSYASIGRYALKPEIFDYLETQEPGVDGQIQLTDAIERMNQKEPALAYEYHGKRYDVGSLEGFLKANILYGLEHEETKEELKAYLKQYKDA